MNNLSRRDFLKTAALLSGASTLASFNALAAPERGKVKIATSRSWCCRARAPTRWSRCSPTPASTASVRATAARAWGSKRACWNCARTSSAKIPLDIEALYLGLGQRVDGSAHMLLRAVSGIEAALWDLAGKMLNVPAATLLGGRFRNRVRMYHDEGPRNMLDKASCRDWADRMKADPAGWTAFKFGLPRSTPATDRARDGSNRLLTHKELSDIRQGFENCREAHRLGLRHHRALPLGVRPADGHPACRGRRTHQAALAGRSDAAGLFQRLGAPDQRVEGAHRHRREPGAPPGFRGLHPATRAAISRSWTCATRADCSSPRRSPTWPT